MPGRNSVGGPDLFSGLDESEEYQDPDGETVIVTSARVRIEDFETPIMTARRELLEALNDGEEMTAQEYCLRVYNAGFIGYRIYEVMALDLTKEKCKKFIQAATDGHLGLNKDGVEAAGELLGQFESLYAHQLPELIRLMRALGVHKSSHRQKVNNQSINAMIDKFALYVGQMKDLLRGAKSDIHALDELVHGASRTIAEAERAVARRGLDVRQRYTEVLQKQKPR